MKFVNIGGGASGTSGETEQLPLTQLQPQMQSRVPMQSQEKQSSSNYKQSDHQPDPRYENHYIKQQLHNDTQNQSQFSNIQKELKPNKVVKGNSVFSNSHKYSRPMENLTPITTSLQISKERSTKSNRAQEASEGSAATNHNTRGSATMKLNAH